MKYHLFFPGMVVACLSVTLRTAHAGIPVPITFVSRQIPAGWSIYWSVPNDMPGVGPHSRFRVCSPGRLLRMNVDSSITVLIDGSAPQPSNLQLIDVNAPDVSYDGTRIVFAGLPNGTYNPGTVTNPGAWRIYTINVDGSNLQQVTFSDQSLNLSQFGSAAGGLGAYDDTDPAWLPDGRIVFSSTRWPGYAQYSGARTSNLYVVDANGGGLHRITSERNGADRPMVDPVTGTIVYARWWRNHRFAYNSMETVNDPSGGYRQHNGLSGERGTQIDGTSQYADYLWRNAWQAAAINPDGTHLHMWGGAFRNEEQNHVYGGAFTPSGDFYANYFPMFNMTEAGGFGGIRKYHRGPGTYTPVIGVTTLTLNYVHPSSPTSYGIFVGNYATEPEVIPDGKILISWAPDVAQDYGLWLINPDGSGLTPVYDQSGTTELRTCAIVQRQLPPVIQDQITQVPSLLPPTANGPYDTDGTFTFAALNVYFNAPVDADIVSAPAIGSAHRIRFFLDHQRTSPGSFPNLDWPILLGDSPVSGDGSVREPHAPANVPLFEQIRSADNTVPLTGGPYRDGAAHVAGMNYGRPGSVVRCVGCHAGHTMIPVPASDEEARWTNLAPGAQITVSSTRDANYNRGLIDRRVMKGETWRYWTSSPGQAANQWVRLSFPVPILVRTVRLYNPRPGGEANSSIAVGSTTVRLYSDPAGTQEVGLLSTGAVPVSGTDVVFPETEIRAVRVDITSVTGTFYGASCAGLAEVEVIGRGIDAPTGVVAAKQPSRFSVGQNFPNPFNPSTSIAIELPSRALVSVTVFDLLGKEVGSIARAEMDGGTHLIPWNAATLTSGVYFYRVRAQSAVNGEELFTATHKMILLR